MPRGNIFNFYSLFFRFFFTLLNETSSVCLTIIFGLNLTSERKHAEFIIMIVHTQMQNMYVWISVPMMPQKVSGVSLCDQSEKEREGQGREIAVASFC